MEIGGIKDIKRVVIKIGSSVLKGKSGISISTIRRIAKEVRELLSKGKEVILVSSGAILFGRHIFGIKKGNLSLKDKQALAAIGQVFLMEAYKNAFKKYKIKVAQILLTHADFENVKSWRSSRDTIECLLSKKVIPIINENDTVATEEIKIGDNDHLSAMVALRTGAEFLLILTNIPYVYKIEKIDGKKKKVSVKEVKSEEEIEELMRSARGASSQETVGGMTTKLSSAMMGVSAGVFVAITDGRKEGCISSINDGRIEGTIFYPSKHISTTKRFLLSVKNERGEIIIDDGAVKAILKDKKSLLPVGVIDVNGNFPAKSIVRISTKDGRVIGRGRVNMDSELIKRIKGKKTWNIKDIIGNLPPEIIHSDYIVFFSFGNLFLNPS